MRILVFLALLFVAAPGTATTIEFSMTDRADVVPGEDLWEYTYRASGRDFAPGFGFSIFFDYTLYGSLEDPPPAPNSDWDVISLQPDVNLPDDGVYDGLALVGSASLSDPFTVRFVWLGSGSPGAQPFVVYGEDFQPVESGTTVPEPSTALLLAVGLAGVRLATRRCG